MRTKTRRHPARTKDPQPTNAPSPKTHKPRHNKEIKQGQGLNSKPNRTPEQKKSNRQTPAGPTNSQSTRPPPSHQQTSPQDIFGKYEDKDYGIQADSDTDCTVEDDEDQHNSRKKSKFDPWTFFVNGAHSILQDTFNEGVQHVIEKNPDIDTEEAEEETFNKLEPRYRAEAIGQYKAFLKLSNAMKKDPLHKKITDTAKRLRDEDEFDEDDALRYAIKKRRYLLDGKLEEFDPPTYSLGEDYESDSLQQSSGSKYAPSQLQQNNSGSRYTQSQIPKRPWINA